MFERGSDLCVCVCVNDANPLCGASEKYPEDETHLLLGNSSVFSCPTITSFLVGISSEI